jgi:hypothetical protein
MSGWIFCLSNDMMTGVYYIGCSSILSPSQYAQKLERDKDFVVPFKVEFSKRVLDHSGKEKTIRQLLKKEKITKRMYKISIKNIGLMFDLFDEQKKPKLKIDKVLR